MARSKRPSAGVSWIVTWPLTVVFAAAIFLSTDKLRETYQEEEVARIDPQTLPERIETLTRALQRSSLGLPAPQESAQGSGRTRHTHRHYTVALHPDRRIETELAIDKLRDLVPGVQIGAPEPRPDGFDVYIGLDGLLTHTLSYRWTREAVVLPRVAIVVGGLGDDLRMAREAAESEPPLSLAIRPFRPFTRDAAELAHRLGREVLLQLRLVEEPVPEGEEFAVNILLDVKPQVESALGAAPHASGVLLDCAAVRNPTALEPLLDELEARNLPFAAFELLETPEGRRGGLARLPRAVRIGSADAPAEVAARQLAALAARAKESGDVVGLAYPAVPVLQAVQGAAASWPEKGVQLIALQAVRMQGPATEQAAAPRSDTPTALAGEDEEVAD